MTAELLGFVTRTNGLGTIDLRRTYAAGPEELWDVLTAPDRIARWMAPTTGDFRVGGSYEVRFSEDDEQQVSFGEIRRCEAPRVLEITWCSPGEAESLITATLTEAGAETELHLVHAGLGEGSDVGHAAGWHVYFDHLANYLTEGSTSDLWAEWEGLRDAYLADVRQG